MNHPPFALAACSLCFALGLPPAQAQTATGDARRVIEDSSVLNRRPSADYPSKADGLQGSDIDHLAGVEILGTSASLSPQVSRYWQSFIGKPVSGTNLLDFRTWLAEEGKKNRTLVFALTEKKLQSDGRQILVVTLASPKINALGFASETPAEVEGYKEILHSRLAPLFAPGAYLDIHGLDQLLDRMSYDLPLNLEATVKPIGPELVDVVIHYTKIDSRPGELKGLMVQFNNHGLRQFGRQQLLGQISFGGLTPNATAQFTALTSGGIDYLSADYEMLMPSLGGRPRVFASSSNSRSLKTGDAATKGLTRELGLGLHRQETNWGELMIRSNSELVSRESINTLVASDTVTSNISEVQGRLTLSIDNERVQRFPFAASLTLTSGRLRPSAVDTILGGRYVKLSGRSSFSHPLNTEGSWFGSFKIQAQLSSRSLDSYNKFSIGGNQGVRAYTSADGVGDEGIAATLELNHVSQDGLMTGLFIDQGRVRPNKSPAPGAFNETYSLQALGLQVSGGNKNWKYSGHVAKGFGGYPLAESQAHAAESKPNPIKFAFSVTFTF